MKLPLGARVRTRKPALLLCRAGWDVPGQIYATLRQGVWRVLNPLYGAIEAGIGP
jgi:hypothetical protein